MTLSLVKSDDPILYNVAQPVFHAETQVKPYIDDMVKLMELNKGVGLAAPQIGIPLRFFVFIAEIFPAVVINPVILNHGKETVEDLEGCLSFPFRRKMIKRWRVLNVEYSDIISSKRIRITLKGMAARIFDHENDHLNGINLFDDRIIQRE